MEDIKFFFTDFHKGTVNIIFHIISFTVMFYGISIKDLVIATLGLAVIDECGHIYNYLIPHKKDPKYNPVRMIPIQLVLTIPAFIIIFVALK